MSQILEFVQQQFTGTAKTVQASIAPAENVTFKINGAIYKVPTTFSEVNLADFLRVHLRLTGTKVTCREGGCGACNVYALIPDLRSPGQFLQRVVNSCLVPIMSCDGWEITTIEAIGTQQNPHPTQAKITEHFGTQCGYCTPGMIMSMYSLLECSSEGNVSEQQVEDYFSGNICRCTGYRPILSAFRSLIQNPGNTDVDLEDVAEKTCKTTGKPCTGKCTITTFPEHVSALPDAALSTSAWYKPKHLSELYDIISGNRDRNLYLVVGHTGYNGPYEVYVDLKGIEELYTVSKSAMGVTIGANWTLTDVIALFNSTARSDPNFAYLKELATLFTKVAHPAVRNVGSWAGNLAMKNWHKQMPSDVFAALAATKARIVIGKNNQETSVSLADFLTLDLTGKIILRLELAPIGPDCIFRTFKIMPRSQSSFGYVTAAFCARIHSGQPGDFTVKDQIAISIGNISDEFVRASNTEAFLVGKNLAQHEVLQEALKTLETELLSVGVFSKADQKYKTDLALSLFYKYALEIIGDVADRRYRSAVGNLQRPLSSGKVTYPTKEENWPVTKPIPKIDSLALCTGEAKFPSDIVHDGLLYAAFAVTERGNAKIHRINTEEAAALPGVIKVFTAQDIPGENNLSTTSVLWTQEPQIFLATTEAEYADQPVAIVVAVTREISEAAAALVTVDYADIQPIATTCEEAIQMKSFYELDIPDIVRGDADAAIVSAPQKVSGQLNIGNQAHFHMETQVSVSFPTEDGVHIEAGTQYLDSVQAAVANCLGMKANRVQVSVTRNGGAFGAKTLGNNWVSAASALAAFHLRRPVKMHMSLKDNLKIIGKRLPYHLKYQAGFSESGKLLGIKMDIYSGIGGLKNPGFMGYMVNWLDNVYSCPTWKVTFTACKTHVPFNQSFRGPGITESIYFTETVLEHAAKHLRKQALEVKVANFLKDGDNLLINKIISNPAIQTITSQLLESAEYEKRVKAIDAFNKANRWRKRGISFVPIRFPVGWGGMWFNCIINIYHEDGTISVTHGGIEMGQGIHTKVAQVVARSLDVDISIIKVHSTSTLTSPNVAYSAGSVTSELSCLAAMDCCSQLKLRLAATKEKNPTANWPELVKLGFAQGVDLQAKAWLPHSTNDPHKYQIYGAMISEVEIDCLTGEYIISRADVLEDVGESISPLIDIGQIEGGVVIGLGYWTTEDVLYNKETGANVTNSTYTYKPPTSKDIPVDFRVSILQNSPNPSGVLRSKAVGEPPLTVSCSVVFALRNAISAFLEENGKGDEWINIDAPLTPSRVQQYCQVDRSQLTYGNSSQEQLVVPPTK